MKKLISLLGVMAMLLSLTVWAGAEETGEIVIVHTNDVHCAYLAYDKVAALAKDADLLIDAGDAVQGDVIGTLSEGGYIVEIMNTLGYDLAVPGNHEFDYGMERFLELAWEHADFPWISANFLNRSGGNVFDAWEMFEVNGVQIAFIGLCTPETFTKSTPAYFQDESGEFIYDFCQGGDGQEFYGVTQQAIDAAEAAGADYVIGVGHLGIDPASSPWTSREVIANTTGFDAFIDAHSHSVVSETVRDAKGNEVLLAQTGTKLANAGRLIIREDGTLFHENINLTGVEADAEMTAYLAGITSRFDALQNRVVARTEVELTINDADGNRAVRNAETNLGDLCADAYRVLMGADVAFVNGGGIRDNIAVGDITYGDIVSVHPFGNEICLVEVTGQQIKDCLELGARDLPGESGGFQHVSGMTYTVDTSIPSSVVLDEMGMFVKVDGPYRVTDLQIGGEPLDVEKAYTLASHNYLLKNQGSGASMFGADNVTMLQDCVMIDNQVLIRYIVDELGGVVGQEYAEPQGRITIMTGTEVSGETEVPPEEEPVGEVVYTVEAGDCLWNIARHFYGSGVHYAKIAEANGIRNPDYLCVGQVLVIPAA